MKNFSSRMLVIIKSINAKAVGLPVFILFATAWPAVCKAQLKILELIDKTESASFTLTAHNSIGLAIDTARAFFISADGLAITSASLLANADTLIVSDHKNRSLAISRVLAVQPMANLAMVQLSGYNSKEDNFLSPARPPFDARGELMIFPHESEPSGSLNIGRISKIIQPFMIGRAAIITLKTTNASRSAPIINNSGNLIGILHKTALNDESVLLPSSLINNNDWIAINQSWILFKRNTGRAALCSAHYADALILQAEEKWIESARLFNAALKIRSEDPRLYALRCISRYQYGNKTGAEEDFNKALNINSNEGLTYYGRALFHLKNGQSKMAINDLLICLEKDGSIAQGFVYLGQAQQLANDIKRAYASFSHAIELDSLLSEAWYERGRTSMQHATDQTPALNDLQKAARLNPFLPGVYTLIGDIKLKRNDYLEAIIEYERALRINPRDDLALMNRGLAYFNTGLKERACSDWEKAGELGNPMAFKLISRHCANLRRNNF
jgi:tetratricopeptide (TPR) repeat protein